MRPLEGRQRAWRLTDEAAISLEKRLEEAWALVGEGRLTWPTRAALLEVSVNTARSILGRKGNDRAILIHAFRKVDLPWEEQLCEPVVRREPAPNPANQTLLSTKKDPHLKDGSRSKRPHWKALILAPVMMCLIASILSVGSNSRSSDRTYPSRQQLLAEYTMQFEAGLASYHAAHFSQAEIHAQLSLALAKKLGEPKVMQGALDLEGQILAARGRLSEAAKRFDEAIRYSTKAMNPKGTASLYEVMGTCRARQGNLALAEKHFQESLRIYTLQHDIAGIAAASRGLGSVAAALGNTELSKRWLASAGAPYVNETLPPAILTDIRARLAIVSSMEGKHALAREELLTCLGEWTRRNHPRWQAVTRLQLASVLFAMGEFDASASSLREAQMLFRAVGDERGAELCAKPIGELSTATILFQ